MTTMKGKSSNARESKYLLTPDPWSLLPFPEKTTLNGCPWILPMVVWGRNLPFLLAQLMLFALFTKLYVSW